MTYATVMVSLALDQSNDARLQVAAELAERFEAAIVGVAAAAVRAAALFRRAAMQPRSLIEQGEASVKRAPRRVGGRSSAPRPKTVAGMRSGAAPSISRGATAPRPGAVRRHHRHGRAEPGSSTPLRSPVRRIW